MSLSSVTPCPSTLEKVGVLVALLFPLIALPVALRRRRLGFALTLVPLLVNGAVAYLQLRRVLEGAAIAGARSVAAFSAGVATAQLPLFTGACAAAVVASIAAFSAWRRPSAERPNRVAVWISVIALALAAAEPLFAFVLARYALEHLLSMWRILQIVPVVILIGALSAFFASRGAAARPLLIATACDAAIGVEAWLVFRHFERIAIHGVG